MSTRFTHVLTVFLATWSLATAPLITRGQEMETEPNNPCAEAQDLSTLALPVTVLGELQPDLYPNDGDVDFYRFGAPPGTMLAADLKGASGGGGTLGDPFLGLFASDCTLLTWNDDFYSLDSRLEFTVGPEGSFVLAATACCDDGDFMGSQAAGTYQLTVMPAPERAVITGRAVDATTGAGLPGSTEPWTNADLRLCYSEDCSSYGWMGWQYADFEGRFSFDRDPVSAPLPAGIYQVGLNADLYASWVSPPVALAEGQYLDLGDIGLVPLATGESISGRIVDGVTGLPLPGTGPPWAVAMVHRCSDPVCSGYDAYIYAQVDGEGRFTVYNQPGWPALLVGAYQVYASANDYEGSATAPFELNEDQAFDVGDIALMPPPVTFPDFRPCPTVDSSGGTCRYSVLAANTGAAPVKGRVWSMVTAYGIGGRLGDTRFQVAGNDNLRVAPGQQKWVRFSFDVPAEVNDGAFICADATFGAGHGAERYFDPLRRRELFCMVKGDTGYALLTPEQAAPKLKALKERAAPGIGKR